MDIGIPELLIVLVIIVLIFGPGRLVTLGKELGTSIREFRKGINSDKVDSITDSESAKRSEQVSRNTDHL